MDRQSKERRNLLQPPMRSGPSRREFMRGVALSATAAGSMGLAACGGGSGPFPQGVASGDPLSDRVILWTRIDPSHPPRSVDVRWEIATDRHCARVVARGTARARASGDYIVKVDATGLQPDTTYFYRFRFEGHESGVGRTRTLPTGNVSRVKLAVFSCANYPAGYFNVYAEAARRHDFDFIVHLGDYIYEYERGGYASGNAEALDREVEPPHETVTLQDYRRRYEQYRSDEDLQALHALAPMIAVWDDHELADDSWTGGAVNHQPGTEGDFAARKAAAMQAYHEWMPTRVARPDRIFRRFDFGNLLSLHMLDTRLAGRDEQLFYSNYFTPQGFDAPRFIADVGNPQRQLLGTEQMQWLQQQLATSTATWQVLGQQVLMGRMNLPAPLLLEVLSPGSGVTVQQYAALLQLAQTDPGALTPEQQAILAQPSIPYNLDAWDSYAVARETVLGTARALDKNLVVLAGDTHNAWASDLQDLNGQQVGVEFATASVGSPGLEELVTDVDPAFLAGALTQLIEPLKYCDTARRGYMLLTVTPAECRADWIYVDTITRHRYRAVNDKSLKVLPGAANRRIVEI